MDAAGIQHHRRARPGWPQGGRAYVPIDDEHTSVIQYYFSAGDPDHRTGAGGTQESPTLEKVTHRMSNGALLDTWRDIRNADNDYMLDREAQKTVSFTVFPAPGAKTKW